MTTLDKNIEQLLHKWPRGFKKRLALFYDVYNNGNIQCCLCCSTNSSHFLQNGEIDWDDLSKYILLCASCHGKIHHASGWERGGKKVPFMEMLYKFMDEKHEKGWWKRG